MTDDEARKLLAEERERILDSLNAATRLALEAGEATVTELSRFDQHPADMGSEQFEKEMDAAVADAVARDLAEVDAALQRIEQGTYGRCETCGEPIADDRLRARPAARYCLRDQARAEKAAGGAA